MGIILDEVPSPLELDNLLFSEYPFLFNNHTHIRFVIQINGHKEHLEQWVYMIYI
jgi:hypothetical protein